MKPFAALFASSILAAGLWAQSGVTAVEPSFSKLIDPAAKIEKLAGDMKFTEGPVWIASPGYLLFSDIPSNAIMKWAPSGLTTFRNPVYEGKYNAGEFVGSNGLTLDKQGRLIACEHRAGRMTRTEKDGKITVLADKFEGKRLNSPNDAVYHKNGDLYFTDPPYGFPKQDDDPAKELKFNGVYRLTAAGKLELLVRDMSRPNGIGFSPDEKKLYVANSDAAKKIWMVYDVAADGKLNNGKVFADVTKESGDGVPDGLKIDRSGNLWGTGPGGIWVYSPAGKLLGRVQAAEIPANCAWGEADGKTLYMTARTGLYRVKTIVGGVRP